MWSQFFAQNAHFVVNLFAALVSIGVCWLYFDAWSNRHQNKELFKWLGFAFLGISFLSQATTIEQSVLGASSFGHWLPVVNTVTRIIAYALIVLGQVFDPLQAVPKNAGLTFEDAKDKTPQPLQVAPMQAQQSTEQTKSAFAIIPIASFGSKLLIPLGGLVAAALYWRRATTGLERHLKAVARAFLLFGIADAIGVLTVLRSTTNPFLYTQVAAFGWVWWTQLLFTLGGAIVLGLWTWGYLLERFFSQLFMILTGMVVVVFMIVSVGFTSLQLRNIKSDSLTNLGTAASVLNYALESRQSETTSAAHQLAGSAALSDAVVARNRDKIGSLLKNYLADKKITGLVVTDSSGQVLYRAQDAEQWGDSLSNDTLVRRSLLGNDTTTTSTYQAVNAPVVQVRSAVSIKDINGNITGGVIASLDLSNAFVDGIKTKTGLQSSIYSGETLSATTLVAPDGKSRPVGSKITSKSISETVLKKGNTYKGVAQLQHKDMLVVFAPIKDVDTVPIGMLLIAQPQSSLLQAAGRSVELTFIIMAILLVVSIYPILIIVGSLVKQIE